MSQIHCPKIWTIFRVQDRQVLNMQVSTVLHIAYEGLQTRSRNDHMAGFYKADDQEDDRQFDVDTGQWLSSKEKAAKKLKSAIEEKIRHLSTHSDSPARSGSISSDMVFSKHLGNDLDKNDKKGKKINKARSERRVATGKHVTFKEKSSREHSFEKNKSFKKMSFFKRLSFKKREAVDESKESVSSEKVSEVKGVDNQAGVRDEIDDDGKV